MNNEFIVSKYLVDDNFDQRIDVSVRLYADFKEFYQLLAKSRTTASKHTHYDKLEEWSKPVYGFIHSMLDKYGFIQGETEKNEKNAEASFWFKIYVLLGNITYSPQLKSVVARHDSSAYERNETLILEIRQLNTKLNIVGTFTIVQGDLFDLTFKGNFDVIAQGNNCFCVQGAGIVIPFKKYFKTDKFPMEQFGKGDYNKLGQIDYQKFTISDGEAIPFVKEFEDLFTVTVCNCYTQYSYGINHSDGVSMPFDEDAFRLCMKKINHIFKGSRIGLPAIGAGLAGGDLELIKKIMQEQLKNCDVTLVLFNKN